MKKNALIIYIIMTIAGVIGLFLILSKPAPQVVKPPIANTPAAPVLKEESITVAMALKNVPANTILTTDDYRLQTLKIVKGSDEKQQFSIGNKSLDTYAINTSVVEGALIPTSALVEPGSQSYLSMFLRPGNVLYTFKISQNDNYLFDNIQVGQGIDIYLVYNKKILNDGTEGIVSPGTSIQNTRLKPLIKDRRVLALRPATTVKKNGVPDLDNGSQLIAELKDKDVKLLKGLEEKAKLVIFPASKKEYEFGEISTLPDSEAMWPVSEDVIFDNEKKELELEASVNQLRG